MRAVQRVGDRDRLFPILTQDQAGEGMHPLSAAVKVVVGSSAVSSVLVTWTVPVSRHVAVGVFDLQRQAGDARLDTGRAR